ncbi:uroporphyrinogen-III synthase [Dermabacter vaginalis]|uniref:uroporphyrinogen-III synthase n=1 Tax=Dermabacter vaginalis TaxID=1630135 RepID=UPI00092CC2BA|nr:uroporphyrinogen-III synthase [Dermabacter vaginalis]MCT2150129.1 uroporphyrinogen-III synthase [Dermabacter vaginalis]SHV77882.1 Possible transcriptional regulatory protein [Mycobacteroides abscessus subsp. abscessus]
MSHPNPTSPIDSHERPLEGLRVAVTAARRANDQIAALERAGASTVHAPTMRIVPVEDDTALIDETRALLEAAPPTFFVTTGQGINSWLQILDEPLKQQVLDYLSSTQIICRGAKGRGAVRKWGLPDAPSSEKETSTSMVELALDLGIAEGPVGLQRHGYVPEKALAPLGDREVYVVAPYRWELAEDVTPVHDLVKSIIAREVDAVTFTAAPAVVALCEVAAEMGAREELLEAFGSDVRPVAVGHVTAEPLEDEGLVPLYPERERLGAMVKLMGEKLSPRGR